jgi:ATP-dependent DNA helicase RecG|tara:strand:+ start:326 stop:2401 length:2076 start_codon:yes stop_codon:yes gene_type:complete
MNLINKKFFLFSDLETISGVGKKISTYLKKKRIEKVSDLLWDLPYSLTDRSQISTLDKLEVGKIFTIKVKVKKHNFPRIRNLPNKILCKDNFGEIDLIFFNSREGYIRKILPLNEWVVVSGKINYFRNKYQITNPTYLSKEENLDDIKTIIPKYSLTEGLKEKTYRNIIEKVINQIPEINEWHDDIFVKKMNFLSWKESIKNLHNPNIEKDLNSIFLKRIAYDEIFANLIFLSNNRNKIKKIKKKFKKFKGIYSDKLIKSLPYMLTNGQKKVISEINQDLKSNLRMFRILQGDVGSGKTIIAKIVALNSIESGYQCGLMAPTSILAEQHFKLLNKLIIDSNLKIKIKLITGKTDLKERKKILQDLENKRIDFLVGTHALFQKTISFNKLGLIIIDEQHKFGVNQRIRFAKKGGVNCDVLLMSATPIPRTMMMSIYGDMDTSRLEEKPKHRQKILTLSKPENKINELWPFIEKRIKNGEQIFWVCPLIEDSKKLDFSSTAKMFKLISKKFPKKVGLIHGALDQNEKDKVLNKFLKNEISILVSTTVIEVGVDFPNATVIIIENSNKFGLAQLHQLRGRIGRGDKSGTCILLYKNQLSQNAKKRILILKSSDDGFYIAEEDMKLRGYGDIVGFKQSGLKLFKIADPVHHEDLFKLAEENIHALSPDELNSSKYEFLLKLFDKVDLVDEESVSS